MSPRLSRIRALRHDESGAAVVEFAVLAVLALMPLAWGALSVQQLGAVHQSAHAAAGESLRAFLTAPSEAEARERALVAAGLILNERAAVTDYSVAVSCQGACLYPGSVVRVRVDARAELPQVPVLGLVPAMTMRAVQSGVVDAYAAPR